MGHSKRWPRITNGRPRTIQAGHIRWVYTGPILLGMDRAKTDGLQRQELKRIWAAETKTHLLCLRIIGLAPLNRAIAIVAIMGWSYVDELGP